MAYSAGDTVTIWVTLVDSVGAAITTAVNGDFTVTCRRSDTDGNETTVTPGNFSHVASGLYQSEIADAEAGYYVAVIYYNGTPDQTFTWSETVSGTISSAGVVASGNRYATVAALKARLGITGSGQDDILEDVIEAASRQIDGYCNRRFYQEAAVTKLFTPEDGMWLEVPDLVSVTAITTDTDGDRTYETTWATTDYDLEPYNADDIGMPYTSVQTTPNGRYGFPRVRKGVSITGTWGWPSVPNAVNEACLLISGRLYKRPAAPFGVETSAGDMGAIARIPMVDPDVKVLLNPYKRMFVGAV